MGIPKSEQKLLEEIDFYKEKYFTFDLPVPFKDALIYPVSVRNYDEFLRCSSCLILNKNDDPEGIPLTHLGYLLKKMLEKEEGFVYAMQFSRLCELVFRFQNGLRCDKCNGFLSYDDYAKRQEAYEKKEITKEQLVTCECGGKYHGLMDYKLDEKKKPIFTVNGCEITAKDFDRFRKIVMYQNLPNYKDDSWVHPAVRADEAARAELIAKKNPVSASLERKILCVAAKSSYKIEEIYDMPMRKFIAFLEVIDDALNYEIEKSASMSGLVKFEKPVEHWVYKKIETDIYGEAVSLQTWTNGIQESQ